MKIYIGRVLESIKYTAVEFRIKVVEKTYIGGFFGLEQAKRGTFYHRNAIALSNGRACFSLILKELKPKKVYVPFYACNSIYEPLKGRCEYSYYSIDERLEIYNLPNLQQDEYLLYIDYFGLKGTYVEELKNVLGNKLIIDDVHRFFRKGHREQWSFCSARKYFGVPDGAYLYSPKKMEMQYERNCAIRMDHLINRKNGKQALAFAQFQQYENLFDSEIKQISITSENMLNQVNYEDVRYTRRTNFNYLDSKLSKLNLLSFSFKKSDPFCYPLILEKDIHKNMFYKNNIFIPTFWPDILQRKDVGFIIEKELVRKLIPVPIDHRYRPIDLKRVTDLIDEIVAI